MVFVVYSPISFVLFGHARAGEHILAKSIPPSSAAFPPEFCLLLAPMR
jgi:hypothetical protein